MGRRRHGRPDRAPVRRRGTRCAGGRPSAAALTPCRLRGSIQVPRQPGGSPTPRTRMDKRPAVVLFALLLPGCAVKTTAAIVAAEQVLRDARESGAEQTAPYELTLAQACLDKAREEWAGSQYQDADRLAAEARAHALEAERIARQEADVAGAGGNVVPEEVAPQPAPSDAEQPPPTDDSELLDLIEDDGKDGEDSDSVLQDDKLDEDIFEEDTP
ncbi:MAG: DUF4398 domain-containing protein [Deltaproteobacteria bacterium]|nr:MAG: DUF4398 domain-containing protein [Deltaproteobacteria bacterium]